MPRDTTAPERASFYWTLPPRGDGRRARFASRGDWKGTLHAGLPGVVTDDRGAKFTYYDHLAQVAHAAEVAGFSGVVIPWVPAGDDPWIIAGALAREARKLLFIPELQPGFATPVVFAKLSVSFQRLSKNRLGWKVDLEQDPSVGRAHGDVLTGADWFQRADEFLEASKGVLTTHPFDFRGKYYEVEKGGLEGPLSGRPLPPTYTSGTSDEALAFAAKHADVHLFDSASPEAFRAESEKLREASSRLGRTVRHGLRLGIIARHSDAEAWAAAESAWNEADARASDAQEFARLTSGPNLWTGFERIGVTAHAGLVGSHAAVAERIQEYAALGVEEFFFDAYPRLEEAYRFAEHVRPKLFRSAHAPRTSVEQNPSAHV